MRKRLVHKFCKTQRHKRRKRKRYRGKNAQDNSDPKDNQQQSIREHWAEKIRRAAVQVVHGATRNVGQHAETVRILFNLSKVLAHLYGTLIWCLHFPDAMNKLVDFMSIFALDLFAETKLPCTFTGFDYFTRINVAILAPPVLTGVIFLACFAWAALRSDAQTTSPPRRRRVGNNRAVIENSNSVVSVGLWKGATVTLFMLDLIYPLLTRTLPV